MNLILIALITLFSCSPKEVPTQFSEEALTDTFITLDGDAIQFKDILEAHKGKQIVIDIWASWCKDCIQGMPKVKALQEEKTEAVYVFFSLDRNVESWKKGIEKHNIKGDHYFMQSGWKGAFGTFVDLDWIPRYMVIDVDGTIKLFKAVKADDKHIKEALQ